MCEQTLGPEGQPGGRDKGLRCRFALLLFTQFVYVIYFIFILFFALPMPLVGLGSLTGGQTHAPDSENTRVLSIGLLRNSLSL